MSQAVYRPSLKRILWTDYPSFFNLILPIVIWIVYLAWVPAWREDGPIIPATLAPLALLLAVGITSVGLGIVIYRYVLFRRLFHSGAQVRGQITGVSLRRDRGWVEYRYFFNHKEYNSRAEIHRNQATKALKTGDHVSLLVDRSQPKRAYIRDLYAQN